MVEPLRRQGLAGNLVAMSQSDCDPVFLDAVLRPAPPLSAQAMVLVLGTVGLVNFILGVIFVLKGAWPVMPFMGLDVLLLVWAFRRCRQRAQSYEHIVLSLSCLHITRHPYGGQSSELSLNPYWLNVAIEEEAEQPRHLLLSSHGRSVEVGGFLAPNERLRLAQLLRQALTAAKSYRN
jgi:uncharacterized membrane protein